MGGACFKPDPPDPAKLRMIEACTNAFNAVDTDNTGTVDCDKLKAALRSLDLNPTTAEVGEMIYTANCGSSDSMTLDEYINMVEAAQPAPEDTTADLIEIFSILDDPQTGTISFRQLINFMGADKEGKMTKEQADDMVIHLDQDGDGLINCDEFICMFQGGKTMNIVKVTPRTLQKGLTEGSNGNAPSIECDQVRRMSEEQIRMKGIHFRKAFAKNNQQLLTNPCTNRSTTNKSVVNLRPPLKPPPLNPLPPTLNPLQPPLNPLPPTLKPLQPPLKPLQPPLKPLQPPLKRRQIRQIRH